jgi:DNA polymerase-1
VFLPWKRGKKQPSTDKEALENAGHSYAALALLAKKYSRLSGVLERFRNQDRAYSHFHLDSSTRRITSSDFQLHNLPTGRRTGDIIPKAAPVRRIFMPDAAEFTIFDMSQIELRVLAHMSQDTQMQQVLNTVGGDIHGEAQKAMGIASRVMAKNFVFGGFCYGGSLDVVSKFTGIKDPQLLQSYLNKLNARFPTAASWMKQQRAQGLRDGYVHTLYGQKLMLDFHGADVTQKHIENCAVNWPIQSSAAEIFKRVMISIQRDIPAKEDVLQVHDELILNSNWAVPTADIERITMFRTPVEVRDRSKSARWA